MFSIIIPTYNRPDKLGRCLEAITHLDASITPFEVIVVDDGGKDSLEPVISSFSKRFNIRLHRQPNAGPAAARNAGASLAKGRFLVFTDDDCQPSTDWLQIMARQFNQFPDSAVTGKTINILTDNVYSVTSQLLIDYLYDYFNVDSKRASFFTSCNLAFPSSLFYELNGFDPSFPNAAGEDRELCRRWINNGRRVVYDPEIKVCHRHDLTLKTFWLQHFGYGQAACQVHRVVAERTPEGSRLNPLSFYLGLIVYPFLRRPKRRIIHITLLMVLSQIATLMGFINYKFQMNKEIQEGHLQKTGIGD